MLAIILHSANPGLLGGGVGGGDTERKLIDAELSNFLCIFPLLIVVVQNLLV